MTIVVPPPTAPTSIHVVTTSERDGGPELDVRTVSDEQRGPDARRLRLARERV